MIKFSTASNFLPYYFFTYKNLVHTKFLELLFQFKKFLQHQIFHTTFLIQKIFSSIIFFILLYLIKKLSPASNFSYYSLTWKIFSSTVALSIWLTCNLNLLGSICNEARTMLWKAKMFYFSSSLEWDINRFCGLVLYFNIY